MKYTVTKLIKKLQQIQKKHPRAGIYVEAESFISDDYTHGRVHSVDIELLPLLDGDGCTKYNKDGSESISIVVTLKGR